MSCPYDEDHTFVHNEGPGDTSVGIMWEAWYVCNGLWHSRDIAVSIEEKNEEEHC